jgi:RNA polymerase sigma-70 factor (ECF subfamily)
MMPSHNTPGKSIISGSVPKDSAGPPDGGNAQLSAQVGVNSNVSSFAMDRGVLAATSIGTPPKAEADPPLSGSAEGLTDAEVMLRVKAGDESAFDYLVQKYRRAMVHFMYRTSRNGEAAEDLAQEVFLRVYRSRTSYEASAKFTTWLYRIATNLAVNHARDTRHERPENTLSLDETKKDTGTTMELADGSPTAEEALVRRERLAGIREKVQSLPERQRIAVIMHKYQQMDYRQIADVMKLSESATKSLLFRAYETLREQLKEFI